MTDKRKENKVDDVLIPEKIKVHVGQNAYFVEEMARKKYKALFGILSKVVEDIGAENIDLDFEKEGAMLDLFNYLSDDVLLEIYHIQLEIPKENIEKHLKMAQEVELFSAIYKVNRINEVLENFTNLVGVIKWPKKIQNMIQRFRK